MKAYSAGEPEQARQAGSQIFGLENGQKAYRGRYEGLQDPKVIAKKQQEENYFKAKVHANPEWNKDFTGAWDEIAAATAKSKERFRSVFYRNIDSTLSGFAIQIVRYVAEVKKPDGERLPGYHESQLESLRYRLLSPAPIYSEMEVARMTGSLQLAVQELGPDDAYLKLILDGRSPEESSKVLLSGSKLAYPAVRKQILESGQAAVDASADPLVVLARKLDPIGREMIKWNEDNVESVITRAGERLGKARFLVYGKCTYPARPSLCAFPMAP